MVLAAGCAVPDAVTSVEPRPNEVAIVRVATGDTLSQLADRLSFPGGWHALAHFNNLPGELIRAGSGLQVPVDYLRAAGIDPYGQMGLEPFAPPLPSRSLAPCRIADEAHGTCVVVAGTRACIEYGDVRDPTNGDGIDDPDGAIDRLELPERTLVVERGGARTVVHLPNDGFAGNELDAYAADLDGDRRDEAVIVAPLAIRNHHGFRFARVFVVGERGLVQLDAAHFAAASLLAADAGRCDLLATSWEDVRHPLDGDGTYFVGRPLRYDAGELVPRGDEVARRFRTHFHAADDEVDRPTEWLATATWWAELGTSTVVHDHHDARITGVRVIAGSLLVDVVFATGERWTLDPRADIDHPDEHVLERIGWAPASSLFPEQYVPADPASWIGADAIVTDESYGAEVSDGEQPVHTLWVTSRS